MTRRWLPTWTRVAWALVPLFMLLAFARCIDPRASYDSFVERAAIVVDAGTPDVAHTPCEDLLQEGLSGQYYTSCYPVATQLPFALLVDQKVTPSEDGKTATLDFSFTPLINTPTDTSQTVGDRVTLPSTVVNADCSFTENIGTLVLPKNANALQRDLVADGVKLQGRFLSRDRTCAGLTGNVAVINLSLDGSVDHCIFIRTPVASPIPTVTLADWQCDPGPQSP